MPPIFSLVILRIVVFLMLCFVFYRFMTTKDRKNNTNIGMIALGLVLVLIFSGYWMVNGIKVFFNL